MPYTISFTTVRAALIAATLAIPALATSAIAADILVQDPYARTSSAMATSGAAFMVIQNAGNTDDRLIDVMSPLADKVELHTHRENAQGVMQMIHVAEGFGLPAGGEIAMVRGGHHVMFLGLKQSLKQGDIVPVTLVFEKAGAVQIDIPVDLERKPDHGGMQMNQGGMMNHGGMNHGQMQSGG